MHKNKISVIVILGCHNLVASTYLYRYIQKRDNINFQYLQNRSPSFSKKLKCNRKITVNKKRSCNMIVKITTPKGL